MPRRIGRSFDEILKITHIEKRGRRALCFTAEEGKETANRIGYPVLVRPSYVLGGQGMQIAYNDKDIRGLYGDHQPCTPRSIPFWWTST